MCACHINMGMCVAFFMCMCVYVHVYMHVRALVNFFLKRSVLRKANPRDVNLCGVHTHLKATFAQEKRL